MTNVIERVVNAIMRMEGRPADDPNPGDVRDPVWFPGVAPLVTDVGGVFQVLSRRKYFNGSQVVYRLQVSTREPIWVPRSRVEGEAGIVHLVCLHMAEGDSLAGFLGGSNHYVGYAPAADKNKPSTYIANVKLWAEIPDENAPLASYLL